MSQYKPLLSTTRRSSLLHCLDEFTQLMKVKVRERERLRKRERERCRVCTEPLCLVRCLGHSQLVSSLSPLVNKLFGGILSLAQTLKRSFTERQLSHKVHAYFVHNSCLTHSRELRIPKKNSCPSHSQLVSSSFITRSQMTKHTASEFF